MKDLKELEKEYEELGKEIERLKNEKPWPDSYEEAYERSSYWGMEAEGKRYLISFRGPAKGLAINPTDTWAYKGDMEQYWACSPECRSLFYSFKMFSSAKELYQWLLDGEA